MNYENLYNGLTKEAIVVPTLLGAGIGSGINYVREKDPEQRGRAAARGALIGGGIGAGTGIAGRLVAGALIKKTLKNMSETFEKNKFNSSGLKK